MQRKFIKLLSVWLLCIYLVYTESKSVREEINEDNDVFLNPKTAKALLHVRKRRSVIAAIVISIIAAAAVTATGTAVGVTVSKQNERIEEKQEIIRTCKANCWGSWSSYSSCTVSCGSSGTQKRTRSKVYRSGCGHVDCYGSSSETRSCNRFCRNGGSLRYRDCACKAGFTGQCCENAVTCGYPGKPSNGEVFVPSRYTHNYNTIAWYSCQRGYRLLGESTRRCTQEGNKGKWTGSLPTCSKVTCPSLSTPDHGYRNGSDWTFGGIVIFSCQQGWTLKGSKTITCQHTGRWSSSPPTCQPITCSKIVTPPYGWVHVPPHGGQYNEVAHYGCNEGYFMEKPYIRTCQINGQWDGPQPTCTAIECPTLDHPENGNVTLHGNLAKFSCDQGYKLHGALQLNCTGTGPKGQWSDHPPICQGVSCGVATIPSHGVRLGNMYEYPHSIQYRCHAGYYLTGSPSIQCQHNASWSHQPPKCTACPENQFKSDTSAATKCESCPPHSHTYTSSSISREQCVCDLGYKGPSGGPCQEILCPELPTPENGLIKLCDRRVSGECVFDCKTGHIFRQGYIHRTCHLDGTWTGISAECIACQNNTYKSSPTTCSPCPPHSHTAGEGNELQGCTCIAGYQGKPGGPCNDVNECQTNNGGCEHRCINRDGSYRCNCRAGFLLDMEDPHKCRVKNSCPPLVPASNGGLVCVSSTKFNIERCEVKCNPGYEHPVRINLYDECGSSTNWTWTRNTTLLPCVEALLPDITLEVEAAYFVEKCDQLTEEDMVQLKHDYISMLQSQGICADHTVDQCSVSDVQVKCGEVTEGMKTDNRRKRETERNTLLVKFRVNITLESVSSHVKLCNESCVSEQDEEECMHSCITNKKDQKQTVIKQTQEKLKELLLVPVITTGLKGGLVLQPTGGWVSETPTIECPRGSAKHGLMCMPCPPGTHIAPQDSCKICPENSYQPKSGQTYCWVCPRQTPYSVKGSTACQVTRPLSTITDSHKKSLNNPSLKQFAP